MSPASPIIHQWLADKASVGLRRQIAMVADLADVRHIAVMPDAHEGPTAPNGLAVATTDLIYPELVGADIGCGLSALRLIGPVETVDRRRLEQLMGAIRDLVPTLKHPTPARSPKPPQACPEADLSHPSLCSAARREGRLQLGSLGRGNHFIELDRDEHGGLWILVHSGSRAMGQAITRHHLAQPGRLHPGPLRALELASAAGKAYLADQNWAIRYASENRLEMVNRIADLLESRFALLADEPSWIDCPHNFARLERIGENELIVHRKSVNSAREDEPGVIPGSMATGARIVRGLGKPEALYSSSHGSGRQMSRSEAAATIKAKELAAQMDQVVFDRAHAAGLRDEAPQAYRDLDRVMQAQKDLVKTVARLKPFLNDKRCPALP